MLTVNDPATVAAVTAAFDAYEAALIANDVPALQAFFWDSPEAIRFGVNEQLYGADEIAAFRQNRVINFSQRRGLRTTVTTLGPEIGSVMYEYVSKVSGIERQGRQSQLWTLIDGNWRIVAAHVSLAPFTPPAGPDWTVYLKHAAAAQNLTIEPSHQLGVTRNLEVIARLAGPLLAMELPDETEPAPVFNP
ncbi:AtzH-like domain-containing protein [Synoicihabitans lomoniglobus]|uniref:DUF3225 domain-containing protein n=1 Tax=Synoicihabitans lomoniglobus TaxID=2909285 RepID=A0AAF0I2R9_9BACT|nr:DUF3225 domain-containing protein [Opitutaceae bacterium LMO-M01]WED65908.1 DUF3225 domain-containing protein [Opitutaceae bacterium LMO-M01]